MIRGRSLLLLAACAALLGVLFYWNSPPPPGSEGVVARSATPVEPPPRMVTPESVRAVPAMAQAPLAANPQPVARPQPPELPYSFLGRITEGGANTIVLHGAGRTLKVRGLGPIDENYVVEAIHDDHLVLRHVATNAQQALGLEARNYGLMYGGSAADTPQD